MSSTSSTPEWVTRFMEEVYPGGAELALSMFDEKTVLTDAATAIRDTRRDRDEAIFACREQREQIRELREALEGTTGALALLADTAERECGLRGKYVHKEMTRARAVLDKYKEDA